MLAGIAKGGGCGGGGGVYDFKIHDEPESSNEGACFEMYDEPESAKDGACIDDELK